MQRDWVTRDCRWVDTTVQPLWKSVQQFLTKHAIASDSAPRHLPQNKQDLGFHKNLYMSVYSSISHNDPKLHTTQVSLGDCAKKHTVVHPSQGILLSKERNKLFMHVTTWMDPQRIIWSIKKPVPKDDTQMIAVL